MTLQPRALTHRQFLGKTDYPYVGVYVERKAQLDDALNSIERRWLLAIVLNEKAGYADKRDVLRLTRSSAEELRDLLDQALAQTAEFAS